MRLFFIALLCFSAGAVNANEHYAANNCEIFVDQFRMTYGSHGSGAVQVFLKVLPHHLDGAVAEVGARVQTTSRQTYGASESTVSDWFDSPAQRFWDAADYFAVHFAVGSNYYNTSHVATFYVRTVSGTTYWLQSAPFQNLAIDRDLFRFIQWKADYRPEQGVPTQLHDRLRAFNPLSCY